MKNNDFDKVLIEINDFRYQLKMLEGKLDDIEKDIRSEFSHNFQKVEWEHQTYDRRISLTEKVVFGTVGIILVTVLGAMLAKIII